MKSIRQQLTLTILSGFGLLLVLSGTAIYFFTRAALLNEFDAGLWARAANIMSLAEEGRHGLQIESPDNSIPGGNRGLMPQYYEVWQTNGTVCTRSGLLDTDLPRRSGSPAKPAIWNLELPGGGAGRAIGLKFLPKMEDEDDRRIPSAEAIVVVAADRQSLDRTLGTLATVLAVTVLLTIAITVPLVSFSLRRGHAPLGRLSRQAATITADALQTRFPVDSMPEELDPITKHLNDLLGRLEASFERERRFSADLAHELRTPLAELRAHAEVELLHPMENGESEKHRETLNIALQMEAMATHLLELARSESSKISLRLESVLIAPLMEEVWNPLGDKAEKKRLSVKFHISPNASVSADRVLFRSILTNLLSNAVEYTVENGQVDIVWQNETEELTVSNTVHDLKADDVPHLFERLWRKDKSRTGGEHCGLGLALSREFAKQMDWRLTARFDDKKTLELSVKTRSESNQALTL